MDISSISIDNICSSMPWNGKMLKLNPNNENKNGKRPVMHKGQIPALKPKIKPIGVNFTFNLLFSL